ncbi:MobA/MobL family protein [Sphingomonas solaris]|uniref:MobA/MobL protein domain-containing protein n=1 Tax=Alterirhizorhabdus solaris TaxID=2529389 RepID=A0A558RA46_9SPHN|nr:MobA/MobL family protein [Sphingomonas solaris]TVV76251.1 hypothetical protein FOY91_04925 [Sphingomonas solaris]
MDKGKIDRRYLLGRVRLDHTTREPKIPRHSVSISLSITQLSSAIREMIDRKELEELVGMAGYGRRKKERDLATEGKGGQGRHPRRIDLRVPAPPPGRQVSGSGATSAHCQVTNVPKTRGNGRKASGGAPSRRNGSTGGAPGNAAAPRSGNGVGAPGNPASKGADRATDFDRYASNEASMEQVEAADFDRYVVGAEGTDEQLGRLSSTHCLASSISLVAAERDVFWKAVWAHERTPGLDRIELFPERGDPADWRALSLEENIPKTIAEAAAEIAERRAATSKAASATKRQKPLVFTLETDRDRAWAATLKQRFGKTRNERMVHHVEPRAGRAQQRLVLELPAEFDAAKRHRALRKVAAEFDRLGVMYTAVIHEPDPLSDRRNYHIHVLYYERRCARVGETETWDIALSAKERREQGVKLAPKLRPGDIAASLAKEAGEDYSAKPFFDQRAADDMMALRSWFFGMCNEQLTERRLDPRSYAEMGIRRAPAEHLGSAKMRLVRAGVMVDADIENALKGWAERLAELERESAARRSVHNAFAAHHLAVCAQPAAALAQQRDWLLTDIENYRRHVEESERHRAFSPT